MNLSRCCGALAVVWIPLLAVGDPSIQTAVAVYDMNSCLPPATSMEITRELTCTPTTDNLDPNNSKLLCKHNGILNTVTNCTRYYGDGYDSGESIQQAFGENPHLVVEKYDPSARFCGDDYGVLNVTVHLLDGACHVSSAGTRSSKITLGHLLTITEYSDPHCQDVWRETDVPYGNYWDRACVNNTRYVYSGPKPPMSVVSVFDDTSCSGTPVKLTMAQGFVCDANQYSAEAICTVAGDAHHSFSSCTTDYKEFVDNAFGGDKYVMVEEFSKDYCAYSDTGTAFVTVYAMDNACHTNVDDATSFRATLTTDGSTIITTFADSNCQLINDSTDFTKRSELCLLQRTCRDGYSGGCAKRFSVGGNFGEPLSKGQLTAVMVFGGNSCSLPATTLEFTRKATCLPLPRNLNSYSSDGYGSKNSYMPDLETTCEYNGVVSTVTKCTRYYSDGWDSSGSIEEAFGETPYLIVEQYDPGARLCGDGQVLLNVTVHLLDETCHVSSAGTTSSKITLGHWLTITEYSDAQCQDVWSETDIPYGVAYNRECVNNATRYMYSGPKPPMSLVSVFDDTSCSGTPVKLTMAQGFACEASRDSAKANCTAAGDAHHSISSCISSTDYKEFVDSAFSGDKYVMVEEFSKDYCAYSDTDITFVTVYVMDDACHTNVDDATSFRATLTTDGSTIITTFADSNCQLINDSTDFTKRSELCLLQRTCRDGYSGGCAKRFSVGGNFGEPLSKGQLTAVMVFGGNACSLPAASLELTRKTTCVPLPRTSHSYSSDGYDSDSDKPTCEYHEIVSTVTNCTRYYGYDYDSSGSIEQAFGENTHVVVEKFDPGARFCGDDYGVLNVTVHLLDGACHVSSSGTTSSKITLGHWLTITEYSDAQCHEIWRETDVSYGNYWGRACVNNTRYVYSGPKPPMSVVSVFDDTSCSGTPVKLTMAQGFACEASRDSAKASCAAAGDALHSISSCISSTDYKEFVDSAFSGDKYVMVEEFLNHYCGDSDTDITFVTVYVMDDACHTNVDDATSFRATLTTDGSTIITTFADSNCQLINDRTDFTKRSKMCLPQRTCRDGYSGGCAKRFSVGGLQSSQSSELMQVTAIYERSCDGIPLHVIAIPTANCGDSTSNIVTGGCNELGRNWFYYNSDCRTEYTDFTALNFGDAPYLIMESYAAGTNCSSRSSVLVFLSDGECHPSFLGMYFRASLTRDNSVLLAIYPNALCRDSEATNTTVKSADINSGECYEGSANFYANLTAFSVRVPTDIEAKTREQIMFPDWLWEPKPRRIFESD